MDEARAAVELCIVVVIIIPQKPLLLLYFQRKTLLSIYISISLSLSFACVRALRGERANEVCFCGAIEA